MASGSFDLVKSSGTSYIIGRIVWAAAANNSGNYSLADADLYVKKGNDTATLTEATTGTWSYSLNVGSQSISGTVQESVLTSWVKVASLTGVKIAHDDDGSKSVTISGSVTAPTGTSYAGKITSGSKNVDLDDIPRASVIASASDVIIGNKCSVKWTPKASTFRYKLKFVIGSWSYTTGAIHPGRTTAYTYTGYTIPLSCVNQYGSGWASGTMSVILYTYSDSACTTSVGSTSTEEFSVILPAASTISSAADVTLGETTNIKYTPENASYYFKINLTLGDWSYTSGVLAPGTTSKVSFQRSLAIAAIAPYVTSKTGTMTATLTTYRDSNCTKQVGSSDSETFTVTVPETADTKPTVSMTLSAVNSSLPSQFDGLFINTKSRVKAAFAGTGKYGAAIESYVMSVDGKNYSSPYQSLLFTTSGVKTVEGIGIDSRGHINSDSETITVIPYSSPRLKPLNGRTSIVCGRCDSNGTLAGNGVYLRIELRREYSPVFSDDVQKNFCTIQYRWKDANDGEDGFNDWQTLLSGSDTSTNYVEKTISGVVTNIKKSYDVEIRAVDDIGGTPSLVTYLIPTDDVTFHLGNGGKRASFGKWSEPKYDTAGNEIPHFELEEDWEFYMKGGRVTDFAEDIGNLRVEGDGYAGEWQYKLWHSGAYQMYGQFEVTPSASYALGVGHYTNQIIIKTPFVPKSVFIAGTALSYSVLCNGVIPVAGEANIAFHLMRFVGEFDTTDVIDVRLQVQGSWK